MTKKSKQQRNQNTLWSLTNEASAEKKYDQNANRNNNKRKKQQKEEITPNDGPYDILHKNFYVNFAIFMKNGEKWGPHFEFYDNGVLKKSTQYEDNIEGLNPKVILENGPVRTYHKNGKIKEAYIIVNGVPNGPYLSFYEDGKDYENFTYKNGKKDGFYIQKNKAGEIIKKYTYDNGKVIQKLIDISNGISLEEIAKKKGIAFSYAQDPHARA